MNDPLRPTMEELEGYDLDRLAMPADQVARLTGPQRETRVTDLVAESNRILDAAIAHMTSRGPSPGWRPRSRTATTSPTMPRPGDGAPTPP